ncbi:MAG TPA: ABC-F family ATP-binding cassette domain-containing protein, partial [Chloroflexota bacterium]|nr:ABC-F family ATP-binding cassette domain-containing protein [Chloroflexota bacterium]
MPVVTGAGLARNYGAEEIFAGVTFEIQERDRIALVGANGSGKTSLLRIIAGQERPDRGTLTLGRGLRIGYLPQEVRFPPEQTLSEYMLGAFGHLFALESELRSVEAALGATGAEGAHEALLERHAQLLHDFEFNGGYSYDSRMREVLAGLGIGEERLPQVLESFSGGQRTRVALARLLLSEFDLLLLDEPTNHLDLAATEWLEGYLAQTRQAVVVVSHDRYFLDRVATETWDLEDGRLECYAGNYSRFADQKAERLARQQREFAAQQEHIERTEAFIRRYKAGQRARQARGRQKQLDRLERVARPKEQAGVRLQIQSTLRSGDTVVATEGLAVAPGLPPPPAQRLSPGQPVVYAAPRGRTVPDGHVLFRTPDVEVHRGDRVAIVGPNGAGKTTFLRVLTGETEPAAGRVYLGYGVQLAYYAQAHEQLDPRRTVLQEIQSVQPLGEEAARTYLGRFLFSADDAFKSVGSLSGGERSRLALARMAMSNANLLVLDEPTNHLDINSRGALEEVLSGFPGTIVFVSHDRYLIDALATHVWEVANGTLTTLTGAWAEYVAARERRQTAARAEPRPPALVAPGAGSGPPAAPNGANGAN